MDEEQKPQVVKTETETGAIIEYTMPDGGQAVIELIY